MLVKENPQSVADYRAGKEKVLNALVGAVMKKTRGRGDAKAARAILLEKLGGWVQFKKGIWTGYNIYF